MKIMKKWLKLVAFVAFLLIPTIIGAIVDVNTSISRHMSMAIFLPLQVIWIPVPFIVLRKYSTTIDSFLKDMEKL